jgi:hypothetical protein
MGNKAVSAAFTVTVNLPLSSVGEKGQKVQIIKATPTDTILQIKQKLQHIIPLQRQQLYDSSNTFMADNASTLSDCLVGSGAMLTLRDSASISVSTIHPALRKRDFRQCCRLLTSLGAGLLVLNILTIHTWAVLVFNASCCMVIAGAGNMLVAFSDEGSFRSFCGSITDLFLAFVTVISFLMQTSAIESVSRAWSSGLHLLTVIIELTVVFWTVSTSMLGQVMEPIDKQKRR